MARDKRFLPTLLDMLDAKGKTILEAWHTEVDGVKFGEQEQNESGNFSSNQPFRKFGNRQLNLSQGSEPPLGGSDGTNRTWPEIDSISFGDYFNTSSRNKPRMLEEMYYSQNIVKFNSGDNTTLGREELRAKIWQVFGTSATLRKDYKLRFYRAVGTDIANVPSDEDLISEAEGGFNAGQIQPFHPRTNEYIFSDRLESDFARGRVSGLLKKVEAAQQELLLRIRPGANRVNITFNIKTNLNRMLQENLLMPSDIPHQTANVGEFTVAEQDDLATAIEEGRSTNINDDTFTRLYLNNRSIIESGKGKNPRGTISGRPITYMQGPDDARPSSYSVFKFEEDAKRATTFTQQRGFIDNVAGNAFLTNPDGTEDVSSLLPAVENDDDTFNGTRNKTTLLKTLERGDSQSFPFMFETVNKDGAGLMGPEFKQYCYLQATLQSLSESYAPSWTSKHFFGRTEQLHTYTMTDRTIDLSFVIFANEIRRLQHLYERVTWLAQQTYASYDDSRRLKAGPLIRMTIGDMFSNLTGFIRSLSFDWSYLGPGGKWEITQGLRIPMACTVQMNFTVIHDKMPDRNAAFYPGPLLHPKGLIGDRGKTSANTGGGPLISTKVRTDAFRGEGTPYEQTQLLDAYVGGQKEMYIDQIDNNVAGMPTKAIRTVTSKDGSTSQVEFDDFIF